jgi:NAD(P)-dependent dehydrogenase (short-subunit alcohol dehydrogenase family)
VKTALVTGGEGGLGRAMRARLEREGYEVRSLDLVNGFDVADPAAWESVGPVDLACLNAGVLTDERDLRRLTDEQYRRALSVNVDGVVFGVRRLAQVMTGGSIVATASLAGLTGMPGDAIYSLTKHAIVGLVRSAAPALEPIRLNAVCPGIADTPMIDGEKTTHNTRSPPPPPPPRRGLPARPPGGGRGRDVACGDQRPQRRVLVRPARPRARAVSLPGSPRSARRGRPRRPAAHSLAAVS